MLLLLKPWRDIERDLKQPTQTWQTAFEDFMSMVNPCISNIVSCIQYFHDCRSSALHHSLLDTSINNETAEELLAGDVDKDDIDGHVEQRPLTEELLAELIALQKGGHEEWHGQLAVEAAKVAKIFNGTESEPWTRAMDIVGEGTSCSELGLKRAEEEELHKLMMWKQQMTDDVRRQIPAELPTTSTCILDRSASGDVTQLIDALTLQEAEAGVCYLDDTEASEQAISAIEPASLHYDQFRAFDIITSHLDATLAGKDPPPLRMLIHGEPGTGKSKVIQTATEHFVCRGVKSMLQKSAYTGIAVSLIDSKTTHTIGLISPCTDGRISAESRGKLQTMWKHAKYLVIDEVSMISKTFLAKLSRNISVGKMVEGETPSSHSFGGISIILCGDFFQFPLVACAPSEALYFPITSVQRNREDSLTGRTIFEEFTTVVTLKQQMHVTDPIWQDFLHHLCFGQVQECHIHMLHTLVLTNPDSILTDFDSAPWNDTCLVTPRHAVRRLWNEMALQKHGRVAEKVILVCQAEDTIKGQPLTLSEHYTALKKQHETQSRQRKQDLPDVVQIAIGMKVMVTQNIETDLDITNGAWGTIMDIWLRPDEPSFTEFQPLIKLKFLPVCILVKLDCTRTTQLKDLEKQVIPVEPACKPY